MKTVNIGELKDQLSHYLRLAQQGDEIIVRDRNRPIARLTALSPGELEGDEAFLVATGQLSLPSSSPAPSFWAMPRPRVAADAVIEALEADREE